MLPFVHCFDCILLPMFIYYNHKFNTGKRPKPRYKVLKHNRAVKPFNSPLYWIQNKSPNQ